MKETKIGDVLNAKERRGILAICALNKLIKEPTWNFRWAVGRLKIHFEWRSSKDLWGRFGGGWDWKVGFQSGGSDIILYFLVCSVRLCIKPKSEKGK